MRLVKFIKDSLGYYTGSYQWFADEHAQRLVDNKIVEYADKKTMTEKVDDVKNKILNKPDVNKQIKAPKTKK
jgi:hypothetical protein